MADLRCWLLACLLALGCGREVRQIKAADDLGEPDFVVDEGSTERALLPVESEPSRPLGKPEEPLEEVPSNAVPPVVRVHPELASFYTTLDGLRSGKRKSPVRVLWLGDSHTAADFMTHPVRERLVLLTRDGGPGFVRLGMDGYRHGAVRFSETGKWRKAPILPSQRTRVLDGIFGYGGIRTLPAAGAAATAELRAPRDEPFSWTLSYRLPPGAGLTVRMGDRVVQLTHRTPAPMDEGPDRALVDSPAVPVQISSEGDITQAVFRGKGIESFSVAHFSGDPQVFGAFGEYDAPGLVLDTVGINGARAATVLAWRPEPYVDQLLKRKLDLIVLAFGTNEVFDQTNPDRYRQHFSKIVDLARQANPNIPCWIVGPPDSAAQGGGSKQRVSQVTAVQMEAAESLGCAFTSAYELMGGEGSFAAWARQRPALARTDRIHLTIAGYQALGELLADALVLPPESDDDEPEGSAGVTSSLVDP